MQETLRDNKPYGISMSGANQVILQNFSFVHKQVGCFGNFSITI